MHATIAQIPIVDGAIEPNLERVLAAIARARATAPTELVIFPETTLCGFPTRENVARLALPLDSTPVGAVRDAARRAGVSVAFGLAEADGGRHYNTTLLVDASGTVVLRYRKSHLWGLDRGVFTPGDRFETAAWNGWRVGLLICYDIEFPEPARALARLGAQLLLVTNGNMDPYGPVHRRALAARAMENQVFALVANRCGEGAGALRFPGESMLVDPGGEVLADAGAQEALLGVTLDPALLERSRRRYRYLDDARIALALETPAGAGAACADARALAIGPAPRP